MRIFPIHTTCKALACVFALLAAMPTARTAPPPEAPSKVFIAVDHSAMLPGRRVNPGVARRMVDTLVMRLTEKPTVAEAWGSLVNKKDRIGIKVAAAGGPVSGTSPEVVDAIVAGLGEAGIPASRIIVWDRNLQDLLAAGYRRDGLRYQLRWVDPATGYDTKAQVSAPVLGKLLAKPDVSGYAITMQAKLPVIPNYANVEGDKERSACLRELAVARALYRLGDFEGRGEKVLRAYADDPRGAYAAHAKLVLAGK